MVGTADHHQIGVLRIGIPQAFRTCERSPLIGRAMYEEHGYLAAAYRRNAILDPFHIEAVPQADPPERRFDQWPPDHSCGPLGYAGFVADELATDSQTAILFAREGIVDWTPVGNGQFPA
jgi:hypothetical protein